jgi:hypothetical protein
MAILEFLPLSDHFSIFNGSSINNPYKKNEHFAKKSLKFDKKIKQKW